MKNEFFGMMLHVRNVLNLRHLEPGTYNHHIALEQAYNSIANHLDVLIEGTTGLEGKQYIAIPQATPSAELIEFVEKAYEFVKIGRKDFTEHWQLARLDGLEETLAILLYKLKYLA